MLLASAIFEAQLTTVFEPPSADDEYNACPRFVNGLHNMVAEFQNTIVDVKYLAESNAVSSLCPQSGQTSDVNRIALDQIHLDELLAGIIARYSDRMRKEIGPS